MELSYLASLAASEIDPFRAESHMTKDGLVVMDTETKQGICRSLLPGGFSQIISQIKDHKRHGVSAEFGPDGKISRRKFYEDGCLVKEESYLNDHVAYVTTFHPNGKAKEFYTAHDGTRVGRCLCYHGTGRLAAELIYSTDGSLLRSKVY